MVGDRKCQLIIQAAATGLLDFANADFADRRWQLKRDVLLDWLARQNIRRIYEYRLQQHIAVLSYNTEDRVFDHHWEQAGKLQRDLVNSWLPWTCTPGATADITEQLTKAYTEEFGDVHDPAYQAEMDRLITHWRESRRKKAG